MYDIIVIGGGPAGMTAAIYARRAAKSVLVLEAVACGGHGNVYHGDSEELTAKLKKMLAIHHQL